MLNFCSQLVARNPPVQRTDSKEKNVCCEKNTKKLSKKKLSQNNLTPIKTSNFNRCDVIKWPKFPKFSRKTQNGQTYIRGEGGGGEGERSILKCPIYYTNPSNDISFLPIISYLLKLEQSTIKTTCPHHLYSFKYSSHLLTLIVAKFWLHQTQEDWTAIYRNPLFLLIRWKALMETKRKQKTASKMRKYQFLIPACRHQTQIRAKRDQLYNGYGDVMPGVTYSRYVKVTSIFEFSALKLPCMEIFMCLAFIFQGL